MLFFGAWCASSKTDQGAVLTRDVYPYPDREGSGYNSHWIRKFILVFNAARDASKNRARILFVNAEFQTYPDKDGSGWNSHCLRKSSLVFNASRDSTNPGAVLSHWGRLTISRPSRIWLHSHWIRKSILVFNAARDASKNRARILFVNQLRILSVKEEFPTYLEQGG